MAQFLVRIYDDILTTNYIERIIDADDRLDAIEVASSDSDIAREAEHKITIEGSVKGAINKGTYEIVEL